MNTFDVELRHLRSEIDQIDRMLLDAIVQRASISTNIAALKASRGLPVLNPQREADIIEDRCRIGAELGLPPESVGIVFRSMLELCRVVSSDRITDLVRTGGLHGTSENRSPLSAESAS